MVFRGNLCARTNKKGHAWFERKERGIEKGTHAKSRTGEDPPDKRKKQKTSRSDRVEAIGEGPSPRDCYQFKKKEENT